MKLKALSLPDVEQIRQWRNEQLSMLRTPFPLTMEQQANFYSEVVSNRQSNARFWGIWEEGIEIKKVKTGGFGFGEAESTMRCTVDRLIGMCGLENISWDNRNAEISLMFNPEYHMDKYGEESLWLLLHEGFMNMNLENIYTEVYECSPYRIFWNQIYNKYNKNTATPILPYRKYYDGQYWHSRYVNINKGAYLNGNK